MVSDECIEAWRSLLLAQDAVLRAIETDLRRAKVIQLGWYDVLLELNAAPHRRLRMADLAARTVLSRTRVSRLVDELAAEGFITREPDPDDGRAAFAVLSTAGKATLRKAAPVYLAGIQRHFTDHLDHDERAALTHSLNKVVDAHAKPPDSRHPMR
ncbi:MAG: MarR family transcriptional regulator [Actinomycetota bacterium]|nr:MarR family transcriptional regulator [Actinomycetota bacterium]